MILFTMYKSVVEKQHMHRNRSRHTAQLAGSVYWVDPNAEQCLSGRTLVLLVCTGIEQLLSGFFSVLVPGFYCLWSKSLGSRTLFNPLGVDRRSF